MSEQSIKRLASIDIYRGLVMFLMMAEMLHLNKLADKYPGYPFLEWLQFHTSHVDWQGGSLHDMIQPSFSFLVGVALPFSLAARLAKGHTYGKLAFHALWRSILLIFLGIFLRSQGRSMTYFTFEDTLTQIGLGYFFLFLIALTPRWVHYASIVVILVSYWGAFAAYPLPDENFNYAEVGVREDFQENSDGFAAHWNRNSNLAWAFDRWFLNLFPRERPFEYSKDNYATLSFIPTLATMLMGLIAGVWLKSVEGNGRRMLYFFIAAVGCLASGWLIAEAGLCPIVKKIWTPTWTLWSGGWCFLAMGILHWIGDLRGWKAWAFPVMVIGANSIAAYVMAHGFDDYVRKSLIIHFSHRPFQIFGADAEPVVVGAVTLFVIWLILFWMYRRRIFIKI